MGAKDILYIYTIRLHWSRTRVLTSCPGGQETIIMRFYYFKNIFGSIKDFQKLNTFLLYDHIVHHVPRSLVFTISVKGFIDIRTMHLFFSTNMYVEVEMKIFRNCLLACVALRGALVS